MCILLFSLCEDVHTPAATCKGSGLQGVTREKQKKEERTLPGREERLGEMKAPSPLPQ